MTLEIKTRWNSVPLVSNHVDQIKSKHIDLHTESGHVAEQVIENFFCRIASAKFILYLKPKMTYQIYQQKEPFRGVLKLF